MVDAHILRCVDEMDGKEGRDAGRNRRKHPYHITDLKQDRVKCVPFTLDDI
jgi:hypothetical protein